ncbi:hypothetical protein [Lactobacillus agrestimuris]|nr:hypothetical protein [Lactobacillus agrestimuris]
MARKNEEKEKMLKIKKQIAFWTVLGAWSIPALPNAQPIHEIVQHLLHK